MQSQIQTLPVVETEAAMAARKVRAHIYSQSRGVMRVQTPKMFAIASRDYQRDGFLPTKRTKPALLKRRYSIDVNTTCYDRPGWQAPHGLDYTPSSSSKGKFEELELVNPSTSYFDFPIPHRYTDFNKWIANYPPGNDATYLQLGTATISNNVFRYITHTDGPERWMRDDGLDMALEVLSRKSQCEASAIGIASSVDSQVCYFKDDAGKEEYAARFGKKRWIFMPINDGMVGVENDGIHGIHWSLVVLDRLHQSIHYYDSLFIDDQDFQNLAESVAIGMLRILGEDLSLWHIECEFWSPHQSHNNLCMFDGGACAPFVYSMTENLIWFIQDHQRRDAENLCRLRLLEDFPRWFGSWFDSYRTRMKMQDSIAEARRQVIAGQHSSFHDRRAIAHNEVELSNEPLLRFNIPPRPVQLMAAQTIDDTDSEYDDATSCGSAEDSTPTEDIQLPPSCFVPIIKRRKTTSSSTDGDSIPIFADGTSTNVDVVSNTPDNTATRPPVPDEEESASLWSSTVLI